MSEHEIRKLFAKNLNYFLDLNDKTQKDLVDYIGVSSSTVSNWCTGQKMPRMDKIQSICNWLGIEKSDLLEDKSDLQVTDYYLNIETREIAQEIFENKDMRILFDASRKAKPEDLKLIIEMAKRFKGED